MASRIMLAVSVMTTSTVGPGFEKPSVYFSPVAQPISSSAATSRNVQAIRSTVARAKRPGPANVSCQALQVRVGEIGREFQAVPEHAIHADVRGPDQHERQDFVT